MKTKAKSIMSKIAITMVILLFPIFVLAQSRFDPNHSKEIITDQIVQSKVLGNQRVEAGTGIVRAVYRPNFTANQNEPDEMAKQYLNANAFPLMLKSTIDDLEHKRTIETPGGFKVQFKQKAAGYPVYGSTIRVSINRSNKVVFVTNSYKPIGDLQTDINTSPEAAILASKNHIGILGSLNFENIETIVYAISYFKSVVAYKVNLIPAEDHFGDWEILVDAGTGKILRAEDKACSHHPDGDGVQTNGSAWVFDPDPVTNAKTFYGAPQFVDNNDADSDSLTAQLKTVTLLDISYNGSMYKLEGPNVVIDDWQAPFTGNYEQESSDFYYTRSNEAFEAVNAYFHLDKSMRYMNETLGFNVMPFQYEGGVRYDPHGVAGENNAYYYSGVGKITFGTPPNHVDLGEDPAVIIHELGHGLHDWITNDGMSQVDGLSEGLSDFWAQSYTRSLGIYEPGDDEYDYLFLWGLKPGNFPTRITNFAGHYPEALNGETHHDGQLWSSSLMSIYDLIGKEATDMNCWEGISMLNVSSNQVDAAFAFIQADIELYGGNHLEQIFDVFYERGYLLGPVIPFFSANETNGEGPRDVAFTDASIAFLNDIVSWEWDFNNDGVVDSYDQNPTYTFTEVGGYSVRLTISDGEFTETLVKENYITVNGGFFVFEPGENRRDFSGAFIRDFMVELGYDVIYSNYYPTSLAGFDAVFLSFGNTGEYYNPATFLQYPQTIPIQVYLEEGGTLYTEGSPLLSLPEYYNFPNADVFAGLFGVGSMVPNFFENPINKLEGIEGTISEGIVFNSSNQLSNWYIDEIIPDEGATISFSEEDYGNVSIYNEGVYGQKTFHLAYALAELVDEDPHSSRYNVLINILEFLGYPEGDGYVVANFQVDNTEVMPSDAIQFTDWSISDEGYSIDSWAWDFDEDGEIDSYEQNPFWGYNVGGNYDIMLVVSNGQSTDTLIKEDLIIVRSGIFVFEGKENGVDQSGTYIRNYLENNGKEVVYANYFPTSLTGFDAVFASFGSRYYGNAVFDDEMANTIKAFGELGGFIYLEGTEALGNDQAGNTQLWNSFGLEDVENGSTNAIDLLQGQEGTIMDEMVFSNSNQQDINYIDLYQPNPGITSSETAFVESDYGAVAVQFDGAEYFGQKTFCMSYSLADLEDGEFPNTRDELLGRITNFFDIYTTVNSPIEAKLNLKIYPNPVKDIATFSSQEITSYELYDLMGALIIRGKNNKVDMANLNPGIYFVVGFDKNSSTLYKGKIIKK